MLPNIHSQKDDLPNCAMFTQMEHYTAMKMNELQLCTAGMTQKQLQEKKLHKITEYIIFTMLKIQQKSTIQILLDIF